MVVPGAGADLDETLFTEQIDGTGTGLVDCEQEVPEQVVVVLMVHGQFVIVKVVG